MHYELLIYPYNAVVAKILCTQLPYPKQIVLKFIKANICKQSQSGV